MGRVEVWRKVSGKLFLFFLLLFFVCVFSGRERKGATPWFQTTSACRDGRQSFLDTVRTSTWRRMFQGYCFSGFDKFEMLSAFLHQDWGNLSKVPWLSKSILMHLQVWLADVQLRMLSTAQESITESCMHRLHSWHMHTKVGSRFMMFPMDLFEHRCGVPKETLSGVSS